MTHDFTYDGRTARIGRRALGPLVALTAFSLSSRALAATDAASTEAPPRAAAVVRVRERRVTALHVARGNRSAEERAREATTALASVVEGIDPVRVDEQRDTATIYVGQVPVLQLGREDAEAAGGEDLHVHAAAVAAQIDAALKAERRRLALQETVFSVSLVVFSGLITFLLTRKLGSIEAQVEGWMDKRPGRAPSVRVGTVEVASPSAVRGALSLALRVGRRVAQVAVVYTWLLIALSLFAPTRSVGERLTGFVLGPAGELFSRVVAALPLLVVAALAGAGLAFVLRTVRLVFASIARGEMTVGWVPPDLALPTGVLLRAAIVIIAVVFAAPLITGSDTGSLSRLALAALIAVGLAASPLLASALLGIPVVFGRTLRIGDVAEVGGRIGRVRALTLLDVQLEDPQGDRVRVPHVLGFIHPTRVVSPVALGSLSVEVTVDATADPARVAEVLLLAAGSHASGARADLVALDARGARWRVSGLHEDLGARVALALRDAGIGLGAREGAMS